jgi:hypothetical protein
MQDESPLIFPKQADTLRLDGYNHFDQLYDGDHYAAFAIKGEKDFTQRYNKLRYIVANFARLTTTVIADMLFGESITIDFKDEKNQQFYKGLSEKNSLITQLYESALSNSRRGDDLFKLRVGPRNPLIPSAKSEVIMEQVTPAIYFPELDQTGTRNLPSKDVLAMVFRKGGDDYLHKEIHVPGYIFHEVYRYDPKARKIVAEMNPEDFGYARSEQTGIERSLIFHIPNVRSGSGFWGDSDYKDMDSLFFAINNRITKTDNILDKHSDPILAVPPGVIDDEGKVKKEALGLIEVDNEMPGFNKPEYIVWNANLDSAFKEIDKLIELLMLLTEISPAGTPIDKGGVAESGRALKFKLLATIRKRKRKILYYDQAIKDMLQTASQLAMYHSLSFDGVKPTSDERPNIKWGDGIVNDEVEMVEITTARIADGTMSKADAIAQLDDLPIDDAKKKAKEIDDENTPKVPTIANGFNGNPNGNQPPAPAPAPQPVTTGGK